MRHFPYDASLSEIADRLESVLADNPFAYVWVTWTCDGCGSRVKGPRGEVPRTPPLCPKCGADHRGPLWGLEVLTPLFGEVHG